MYAINAVLIAKDGCEQKLEKHLLSMVRKVESEENTVIYTLHKALENPCKFMFYELYTDLDAIEFHKGTEYFEQLMIDIEDILSDKQVDIYKTVDGVKKTPSKLF